MNESARGTIELQREGSLATISLAAPWRGNALDNGMLDRLASQLEALSGEAQAPRCLVLTGAGDRHFSTGFDLNQLLAEMDQGEVAFNDLENHPLERAVRALDAYPFPTVALLKGAAIGAGCELALACDLRFARSEASLCMPPAKLGVLYSITGMRRLVELVGMSIAKEMFFTAKPVSGRRAEVLGLVNQLIPPENFDSRCRELCEGIAANAPLSLRHSKTALRQLRPSLPKPEVMAELLALRAECFLSGDLREAIAAFQAKRPAHFQGR